MTSRRSSAVAIAATLIAGSAWASLGAATAAPPSSQPDAPQLLVTGLEGSFGSTVGPGGALYVAEGVARRISRVDPKTGEVTTFASGLPEQVIPGAGGAQDVAFIGGTAYVLVSFVGSYLGSNDIVGIYRVDGPRKFTVVADIGAFNVSHPPNTEYELPTGVQTSLHTFRGGFLVTDGHLNRVLRVTLDGEITEFIAFGNTVPTGLEVRGNTVYMSEAGPLPHLPKDGKVVSFGPKSFNPTEVASGGRLLVDVERGRGHNLYALAQGIWPRGTFAGHPALPNTGQLLKVDADGTFTVVAGELNQPTSVEFIKDTAYVVTLTGEIWTIDNVAGPPYGKLH